MSQPFPRLVALVLLAVVAGGVGLIATRTLKGGEGGDASARTAVEQAFGGNSRLKSGRMEATLEATVEGAAAAQLGGPVTMQLSGAFDERRSQPEMAFDASVKLPAETIPFAVVARRNEAFVKLGGSFYEVPKSQLETIYGQSSPSSAQQAFAALGFNPGNWLANARDEGFASVDGVRARHVSADVDVGRVLHDLIAFAKRTQPAGVPNVDDADLEDAARAFEDPRIDVYTGASDGILRRMTIASEIDADDASGKMSFDVRVSDVNEPQRIVAPASARPFSALESDLRAGGLAALSAGLGAPAQAAPSGAGSGGQAPAVPGDTRAYLACIRKAGSSAELQRCGSYLP